MQSSKQTPESSQNRHVLVGHSSRLRHVQRMVEKLGNGRWPALILGETGTGKEVVARSIFKQNAQGNFVTIDCSAFVGPIMESELFGHLRGAFTGADRDKMGLIEAAHNGTAFFDEIGELPLDLQAKLLRVLQEKEFRPLGSNRVKQSDFRIIAATNRDLAKEVEKGTFRQDLYFRLNVVTVKLAPLRERKEDLPALIQHFLLRYGKDHSLANEALDLLLGYDWPGNIRELENCIQHMVAVNSGPLIMMRDLPSPVQNAAYAKRGMTMAMSAGAGGGATGSAVAGGMVGGSVAAGVSAAYGGDSAGGRNGSAGTAFVATPVLPLAEVERRAILGALEYTKGDRLLAASLLGIGRTTLYRKMREYEMAQ